MSSSPYISETLRNYLLKFQIQQLVNGCVNSVCREMPTDPYSFIVNTFQKNASSDIQIIRIIPTQIYNADMVPVLSLRVQVRFMEKDVTVDLPPLGIANDLPLYIYDEDRLGGKGLNKGIEFIQQLNLVLKDKICSKQNSIDNILLSAYETKSNKGLYQINVCSYVPPLATAKITNTPVYQVFRDLFGSKISAMKVCINVLQGSKLVNSKCKVFKYMIMCDEVTDPMAIVNVVQSIKKSITSGKGGEAALKYSPDGTFICPVDTITDNLKIVEEAINSNSNNTKDKLTIGISWMADNFYNPDQKKYELENPKALLDTDQLIQYYFKLCTDRPLITLIQDPMYSKDPAGWNKLQKKFENSKVRIGSRKVLSTIQEIKQNLPIGKEDQPEFEQAQIIEFNNKKVKIFSHWYRPFELITLSKLIQTSRQLRKQQVIMILSENMIETSDTTLTDLCFATGSYLNLSCPIKFNQINKLNRIIQILKN